jgi:chromosome segregation ATPase
MASGSRGRGGYRPSSLRMRAGGGPPEDDVDPRLVHLRDADLLEHLRGLLAASGSEDGAAVAVLSELERRLDEADSRIRAGDKVEDNMRDRIHLLERKATEAKEEIRQATETSARLREKVGVQKRAAAEVKASHQAALQALEQRALGAEAHSRRASESEALLQTKIQELEQKITVVEANHRAEIEALESRAARAEEVLKDEITRYHTTAMNFQVRLEATISKAEAKAAILESRVTQLQGHLEDDIRSHDRMAMEFQDRIDGIVNEAQRGAAAVEQILAETKKRMSDEASKRSEASKCQEHLGGNNNVSVGECATNKDEAGLLSMIHAGKQKAAEMGSHILCKLKDTLYNEIQETNSMIAELQEIAAKNRALREAQSPLRGSPVQTSER